MKRGRKADLPRRTPKRRVPIAKLRSKIVSVRMTKHQHAALAKLARLEGLRSVSQWIQARIEEAA